MTRKTAHRVLTVAIAGVWIVFGLYCKVLDLVPRHEEIVARILGATYSASITRAIGGLEVLMGLWILTGVRRRLAAVTQMVLVAVMNLLEILLARDLLLWGPSNALFALAFIGLIYLNEWKLAGEATR